MAIVYLMQTLNMKIMILDDVNGDDTPNFTIVLGWEPISMFGKEVLMM